MKKVIQLILFLFLIIISIIFYKIYFGKNEQPKVNINIQEEQSTTNSENNLIKNLKYEVKLDQDNQYIITSDLSEITYENNVEIVKMQNVVAILIDQTNIPLIVTSDQAIYNNSNYNTKFNKNVRVEYLDNFILSDNMDLDFNNNLITINQNVEYNGTQGTIIADNVKIDLITKKIEIYMDNTNDNVEITTK
jgi:LPS export ABC transporter protein LptC